MGLVAVARDYALVIKIPQPVRLQVGRLGDTVFPGGYWLYFGSALNGLEARLRRHLRMTRNSTGMLTA